MAGNVDILRRYNSKYPLRDTQVKSIKVAFEGASEKQRRLRTCVEQLLGAVFAAYKRNGFENNKKLDLYQSYKFLSNIADENKDFVKMLVENRDRLIEESDARLDELVKEGSGIGKELFKKSGDRLAEVVKTRKSDVCAILDELLRDYAAKHPDGKAVEAGSGTTDAKKRLEEMEKAIDAFVGDKARTQANDGIQKFRTSVFRSITGMLERFSRITFGKRTEGQAALLPTSGKLDETPKEDAKILRDELKKTTKDRSKFQKNLDKTGAAVAKTFSILGKNENSRSAKMRKILVMTIVGVRRMDTRGILGLGALWRRGAAGKIGATAAIGAVSAFKLGSFAVKSAFGITKSIIGGVWSLGKGIVGGVSRAVSGIYRNYMKPILPMLFKFMITPQGAFITGYLSHMVVSKVKKLFSRVTGLDGKKIKELFLGMLEKVTAFIGNINFKQLFAAISFAGSTILYPLVKRLIEGLLPENLVWRGAKSILGNALGWATHSSKIMGLAKTAMFNPMTWLFTASVGTFVAMGNQITNTIDKV